MEAANGTTLEVLARLTAAVNARDLAAMVACFDPDYESEQPVHPDRRFVGRDHVERNWAAMFAGLPDFRMEVMRSAVEGDTLWVEWRWTGTRADGTRLDARGPCVFGVRSGLLAWGRLYMEDVEAGQGIQAAVSSLAGRSTGVELTHILVVSDISRSRSFYRDVVGASVYREYGGTSCVLQFQGAWLLLVTGGGPTPDKPAITFGPPGDPSRVAHAMTIRVPSCQEAYDDLRSRGARFLTAPHDWGQEVRCFFQDPDGHLLEISEAR